MSSLPLLIHCFHFLVSRLKLELNFLSLLPQDHPTFRTFLELTETIGLQSRLVAVVEMPKDFDQKNLKFLSINCRQNISKAS